MGILFYSFYLSNSCCAVPYFWQNFAQHASYSYKTYSYKIVSPPYYNQQPSFFHIQDWIFSIGHKPGEVGTGIKGSWESGWASDVDRVPGLEAVEMQAQAEALWIRHSTWEPQVNSLCGRILQPRDAKRLRPSCKHNYKHVLSKYCT